MKKQNEGFTLIEILIVIAIVGILAGVVFVALDPLTRFQDARDSSRWDNITEILSAIKLYQVDNKGSLPSSVSGMKNSTIYMIGTDTSNCNAYTCDLAATATSTEACVDLTDLVNAGYLGHVPVSPDGIATWTQGHTGYALQKTSAGVVTASACESENSIEISISR